jgi:hypothetical protein
MKTNKLIQNLILITIFLIPFYFLRFKLAVPTNIFEIAVLICSVFTICHPEFISGSKNFRVDYKKWVLPIFLVIISLIASFISDDKTKALGIFKGWFVAPVLFAWVISKNFTKKDLPRASIPIYFSVMSISLWALLQKIGVITTLFYQKGDTSFDQYLSQGRAFGPFESPNYLAMFLVPMIFLALPILWSTKRRSSQIVIGLSFLLPILALIF